MDIHCWGEPRGGFQPRVLKSLWLGGGASFADVGATLPRRRLPFGAEEKVGKLRFFAGAFTPQSFHSHNAQFLKVFNRRHTGFN
jgi:hypothetical protein